MIRLFLFGAPRIEQNAQAAPLRRTRAIALLAYAAVTGMPHDRAALLALLWPEFDDANARNNLRRELSLLRSTVAADLLRADRQQVAWNAGAGAFVDVAEFRRLIASWEAHGHAPGVLCDTCAAALTAATQLAGDDLLTGFSLPDSAAFDEWLYFQREELRTQRAAALQALARRHQEQGEYTPAIAAARRWLALDPLHEPAQRELMRLYALAGQRTAALRQYEVSARLLDEELGAMPEPETTTLYEAIVARQFDAPAPETTAQPAVIAAAPPRPLPAAPGFVGRQREQADIVRRLTDPACRLLTLVGPGGIGKTRLALQVAHTVAEGWTGDAAIADGVVWVPLVEVATPAGIAAAVAAAAQFDFYPGAPPHQQLIEYLRERRMLIVLDNFEHLLEGAAFVAELLQSAPHIRLLATSRESLNLAEEWFHPLDGLSFPGSDADDIATLARFDAIRFFEQHARRMRADFSLSRERAHVVRLCRLVEGMPLALELAASWLKVLPLDQVVGALERGIDILSSRDRTTPARHQSMRSVLDESWRLLAADERQALAGLSLFVGAFDTAAAQMVAGTTLGLLATLVEKSLLRPIDGGRFQLHELLRQYAAERLAADPAEETAARARHSACFLAALAEYGGDLQGARQPQALAVLGEMIGDIRAAWARALAGGEHETIRRVADALYMFYLLTCRYQEGAEAFAAADGPDPATTVLVQVRHAAFVFFLGKYEESRVQLTACLESARRLGLRRDEAIALGVLGQIAGWTGDMPASRSMLQEALAISAEIGDEPQTASLLQQIAALRWDFGEYADVARLGAESLAISRRLGRPDLIAGALEVRAGAAMCLGEYAAAEQDEREALAIFERIGHRLGVAMATGGLGLIRWAQGGAALHEAIRYFEQSQAMMQSIGHGRHMMDRLNDLARAWCDLGDHEHAAAHGHEALALARAIGSPVYTANSLCCLATIATATGNRANARVYLREAIAIAIEGRFSMALAEALLYVAELFAHEADARALPVVEAALRLPTWHTLRERARQLREELMRQGMTLPHEEAVDIRVVLEWVTD
jgi:predicted ATPase/DNA-binding SARP family transcriptional activator